MITAREIEPGRWIARRYCTRIAQHLEAFHAVPSRYGFAFPGARIEAESFDALQAALDRVGNRKVWA